MKKSEEHTAFRRTKEWRNFRKEIIKERGNKCEVCGSTTKGINLHHCNEEDYYNLDPDLFILLCKSDHKNLHRLMRRKSFDIDLYILAFKDAYNKTKSY